MAVDKLESEKPWVKTLLSKSKCVTSWKKSLTTKTWTSTSTTKRRDSSNWNIFLISPQLKVSKWWEAECTSSNYIEVLIIKKTKNSLSRSITKKSLSWRSVHTHSNNSWKGWTRRRVNKLSTHKTRNHRSRRRHTLVMMETGLHLFLRVVMMKRTIPQGEEVISINQLTFNVQFKVILSYLQTERIISLLPKPEQISKCIMITSLLNELMKRDFTILMRNLSINEKF